MIGILWNCRGVSKKGLSSYIKELIWDHKPDFIGLQETMMKSTLTIFSENLIMPKSSAGTGLLLMASLVEC